MATPWDDVWAHDVYANRRIRQRRGAQKARLMRQLGLAVRPGQALLDVGCGDAAVLTALKPELRLARRVAACDSSSLALRLATENIAASGLEVDIVRSQAESLPFEPGTFDTVIALGVLEHSQRPDRILQEIRRVLKDGGTMFGSASSVYSAVFVARKLRELVGVWPYGYQHNYAPRELRVLTARFLRVDRMLVAQTDSDLVLESLADRVLSRFDRGWGRYIVLRARKDRVDA